MNCKKHWAADQPENIIGTNTWLEIKCLQAGYFFCPLLKGIFQFCAKYYTDVLDSVFLAKLGKNKRKDVAKRAIANTFVNFNRCPDYFI